MTSAALCIERPAGESLSVAVISKALTVATVFSMSILQVVWRDIAPVCTLGVIAANIMTKALKLAVREVLPPVVWRRPAESHRDSNRDPGFPSSHTSNMAFVCYYFSWYLRVNSAWGLSAAAALAVLPPAIMAAARMWDRDHTPLQTFGGLVCGWTLGAAWVSAAHTWVGRGGPQPWGMVSLCYLVGLPMFLRPLFKKARPGVARRR